MVRRDSHFTQSRSRSGSIDINKYFRQKVTRTQKTEQKKNIFRFFRLPLQKEQDAEEAFGRLSKVLHELDIPVLYSVNILQEHCN